ncbi:PE domain-containing protein [Saccharopolyspora sp. HNM0983]|uniref:PE domain-containing protein n=1 Tax=Saccharopolyspora montiporae TaxID=2781240 RepID=A0A929B733_9PSEU|nr:PE domain-containing protein [Saccharopolyspora sp. HNM0983]MBE9374404.1 PE domain-containing protein [Saccharopolyspora sp. HNM0983]
MSPSTPPAGVDVDPDGIQVAAADVRAAAQHARERLVELRDRVQVLPPAADPVSTAAAQRWQETLVAGERSHFGALLQRVAEIEEWCRRLDHIADEYAAAEAGAAHPLQQLQREA